MTKPVSPLLSTVALILGFAALLGAALAGYAALVVLLGLAVAAGLLSKLWSHLCLRRVTGRRHLSERRVFPGEDVYLTLQVVNRKLLPLPWVEIRDTVPEALVAGVNATGPQLSAEGSLQALSVSQGGHRERPDGPVGGRRFP